ncbi:MAG TPA: alpha/beta fold hydrolase [Rubrobacteraceae bacterium]|nr:alpha/beta fold hydrolase [Rubrobacteraceae bacterium]
MRIGKIVAAGGVVGGLGLYNRRLEGSGGRLGNMIGGETRYFRWGDEDLAYVVAGEGPPLLMVHGVYAGASSFEFRKNFLAFSESFRVYALDLLGCGLSARPRREYEPEDVTSQIENFAREEIGKPTHLIASSLTAALATPALVRSPRLFKKAVLICPTGYGSLDRPSGKLGDVIQGLFAAPVLGDTLYHAIVSRPGLRYFLGGMSYHDRSFVTEDLIESYYKVSHQPGAKHFPAAFVAGKLNLGVAGYWPRVPHRTMICWGQEAKTTPVSELQTFLTHNPRTAPRIFRDAALLPHDERAETFNREVTEFLLAKG